MPSPPASAVLREAARHIRLDSSPDAWTPALRDALARWLESAANLEDREQIELYEAQMVARVFLARTGRST